MPTLRPRPSWSVIVISSPVVAEADVADVEPNELGAATATIGVAPHQKDPVLVDTCVGCLGGPR
jgi:hypothetical protein